MSVSSRRVYLAVFLLSATAVGTAWAQELSAVTPPVVEETAHGPYVPMMFPLLGSARFQRDLTDTYGDPRDGGRRQHAGQDIMAPQMTPIIAVFDGVVYFERTSVPNAHNILYLKGDNGWTATYLHINNDTPGTNDGRGSREYAFAPDLVSGQHVTAGQFVAWVGNSGNAETVGHHLHFELAGPQGIVNAYTSLKRAQRLASPRLTLPAPEIRPAAGEIRLDGVVREVDTGRAVLSLDPVAWVNEQGKINVQTKPGRKWVRVGPVTPLVRREDGAPLVLTDLKEGDFVTILAPARSDTPSLTARRVVVASVTPSRPHERVGGADYPSPRTLYECLAAP